MSCTPRTRMPQRAIYSTSRQIAVVCLPAPWSVPWASHHLRQAIRVVTSGAHRCYGQLVVLGYKVRAKPFYHLRTCIHTYAHQQLALCVVLPLKNQAFKQKDHRSPTRSLVQQEFLVRDSTWHRVGQKNASFVLTKRDVPNGVEIGGRSRSSSGGGGGGSGGGEGKPDSSTRRIRIVHENNVVLGPLCCQGDGNQATTTTPTDPVCSTPTYDDAPAENGGDDTTGRHGAGHGCPSDFKTPEPRPNGMVVSDSCGGRDPAHRRARGGGGAGNTNGGTAGGNDGRGGYDAGGKRDGGRGHCFPSNRLGSGRVDVAEGDIGGWETQYRMQLLLSAEQREAAEGTGVWRSSKTRAAAAAASEESRGDVVNIACSAIDGCDMYQLGRMEGGENDFAVRGPLHQSKPGGKVCGPVSRYAVRLLVNRAPPHRCRIFAGGFNSR